MMNVAQNIERVRISTLCNVDYHNECKVNDTQCRCNCHVDTWTFEDDNDLKNVIMRVSYDLWMSDNIDPINVFIIFNKTFEKLGYSIVPTGKDTNDKTVSLSKIDDMVNICVELNKRSKFDGWGMDFPERLANEWGVLTDIYPARD